jgi:hypothetical protein
MVHLLYIFSTILIVVDSPFKLIFSSGLTAAETNHALQAAAYPAIPFPGVGKRSPHRDERLRERKGR